MTTNAKAQAVPAPSLPPVSTRPDAVFSVVPLCCGAMLNDAGEAMTLLQNAKARCHIAASPHGAAAQAHLYAQAKARLSLAATLLRRAADSFAAYGGE